MYKLPAIESVPALSVADQELLLDHLFEPCATLKQIVTSGVINEKFHSYNELIERVRAELLELLKASNESDPRINRIIGAHPRLGAQKVDSSHSQEEQKSLQAKSAEEGVRLEKLNKKYEDTFPGLIYVVFVNGRSREVIMENMEARIKRGDVKEERKEAFNAMCDIAKDRASKL
ncbi:putative allantoinase 1 [Yarrowia sp. B02]|nr:putative allantoinase 1 [Yarrowia sp. B02]